MAKQVKVGDCRMSAPKRAMSISRFAHPGGWQSSRAVAGRRSDDQLLQRTFGERTLTPPFRGAGQRALSEPCWSLGAERSLLLYSFCKRSYKSDSAWKL